MAASDGRHDPSSSGHLMNTSKKLRQPRFRDNSVALLFFAAQSSTMRYPTLLVLVSLMFAACGRSTTPSTDLFGAYNDRGGSERNNDFSSTTSSLVTTLTTDTFPTMLGGFRTPPLDVGDGRRLMLFSGRTGSPPLVVMAYGDSVLWRCSLPRGHFPLPALAADSALTAYVSSARGNLNAIGADGRLRWSQPVGRDSTDTLAVPTPPLALGDGAVVGNNRGRMARFDGSGRVLWAIDRGGAFSDRPCARPDVGIVAALSHNDYTKSDSIVVLDTRNGAERWCRPVPGRVVCEPVVAGSLIVIGIASIDSNERRVPSLIAFTFDGKHAWRSSLPLLPRGIAAGGDGSIFASCAGNAMDLVGGALVAFDSTGKQRWLAPFGSGVTAPPSVTANWLYFIARREGRTGLYTYGIDGAFGSFVPIDILPDVSSSTTISSFGRLVLSGLDVPTLLVGG